MGNLGYMTAPPDKIRGLERKSYSLGIRDNCLVELLRDSHNKLELLRQNTKDMLEPPSTCGIFLKPEPEKDTTEVFTEDRRMRPRVQPEINGQIP